MATVREVLTARIQGLLDRKRHLAAEILRLQSEIDTLVAERDTLSIADENKFARLQALAVIQIDV